METARSPSDDDRVTEADIRLAETPFVVKLAAVVQGVTGLLVALSGLQVSDLVYRIEWASYVPYAQIALGVTQIGFAAMQLRSRRFAGVGSVVLGGVVAIVMIGWLLYMLTSVLSCIMYLSVLFALLDVVLGAVAIGPLHRTAAAKQRLADRGMDLGL